MSCPLLYINLVGTELKKLVVVFFGLLASAFRVTGSLLKRNYGTAQQLTPSPTAHFELFLSLSVIARLIPKLALNLAPPTSLKRVYSPR